jgi:hypothetical protein
METNEALTARINELSTENERLYKQVKQYSADLDEIRNIVFDVLKLMGLMNEAGNNIKEKYWPADGKEGENPLPDVIAAFTDLGFEYNRSQNKYVPADKRKLLDEAFKHKVSFIWRAKEVFNRYAQQLGAQKMELVDAPQPKEVSI